MPDDLDWRAAADPATSPEHLADIAARRWDLHPVIAANPQAYPALRVWMAQVNPAGAQPTSLRMPADLAAPVQAPRRRGIGCWIVGCGGIAVVAVLAVVGALIAGIGAATPPEHTAPAIPATPSAQDESIAEQLAIYEAEHAEYDKLAAELEGNPVAPLVTESDFMQRLEREAAVPNISEIAARAVAQRARDFREELQARVTAAQARRVNSSGTLTEQLVDQAGDGYIDVRWDAATACGDSEEGRITTGCVISGSPLTVHLQAESQVSGDWERKMVVAHELAHVYQHADARRFEDGEGDADRLLEQGLFQGSAEKMADCYALTYYDQPSLSHQGVTLGYGYVCNAAEREAVRDWAAAIEAPMPG